VTSELTGALIGLGGALFGALLAGGISMRNLRQTQRAASADEFRNVVQQLVDLRIQVNSVFREYANDTQTREFVSSALNVKRQLHKATAARILKRAAGELAANDFAALGYEYQSDSEFGDALRCYQRALERTADSQLERVNVLRSLGALLLQPTTLHDRRAGEAYFREAIELTNGQTDDYSRYTTGYTYEMLAIGLLVNRYPEWRVALATAGEHYEAMTSENPLRQAAIDSLNMRRATAVPATLPPATKPLPNPADAAALEAGKSADPSARSVGNHD
jgi:hypothetical protein